MDNSNPLLPHFERIHKRIVALWGTQECRDYINTLLTDTRDGTRSGFPPVVAKELFRLLHEHDLEFRRFSKVSDIVVPFKCHKPVRRTAQPEFDVFRALRFLVIALFAVAAVKHLLA